MAIAIFLLTLGTFGALEQGSIGFLQFFVQVGIIAILAVLYKTYIKKK